MKLHLGCGKRFIKGFIHIDAVNFDHIDHVANIDRLSFIPNDSVDLIYNCHVLEHFKRREVLEVLKEWHRVLKKDGVLRIAVPDFNAICSLYQSTKNLDNVIGPIFGRQDYLYNIHYNVFDFEYLKKLLISAGFHSIKTYDWRTVEHSYVGDYSQSYYPHMDKDNGLLLSLNVECVK